MKYWTCDRDTGNKIESFDTIDEAVKAIDGYETQDREDDTYTDNFYAVEDDDFNTVWTRF